MPGKDSSISPPLKPIEEVASRKEGTINGSGNKIIIGASSTQSKFYVPHQKTTKIAAKGSRNSNFGTNKEHQSMEAVIPQMKSYNITQEKFFPSRS